MADECVSTMDLSSRRRTTSIESTFFSPTEHTARYGVHNLIPLNSLDILAFHHLEGWDGPWMYANGTPPHHGVTLEKTHKYCSRCQHRLPEDALNQQTR